MYCFSLGVCLFRDRVFCELWVMSCELRVVNMKWTLLGLVRICAFFQFTYGPRDEESIWKAGRLQNAMVFRKFFLWQQVPHLFLSQRILELVVVSNVSLGYCSEVIYLFPCCLQFSVNGFIHSNAKQSVFVRTVALFWLIWKNEQ